MGIDKNAALFSSFLLCINIYSISSAQELRCYSLCGLFSVLSLYLLFKIKNENNKKDYILYTILAILMANTHYFEILILIGNFIFALFVLDNKSKLKFFIINLIAAVSFLPYFLMTALNKALLDPSFNLLVKPDLSYMINLFTKYYFNSFIALIVFILFILILIPKIRKYIFKDENSPVFLTYISSLYVVLFLFVSSFLFSNLRPIIREYYYVSVIPLIILPLSLIFFMPFKKKIIKFLIILILLTAPLFSLKFIVKENALSINFEPVFNYLYCDSPQFRKTGLKIGVAIFDDVKYADFYKKYLNGDEIRILYKFPLVPSAMPGVLTSSNADIIYMRLEYRTFLETIKELSKFYKISIVRTNKDVLIARLIRYKK